MDFGDRNMNIRNRSDRLYARSKNLLPGGVNSPVRAFAAVGCDPVFIAKANGSVITDVDGCHYIDFCQSWGPLILGHTSPDVITAVQEAADRGEARSSVQRGSLPAVVGVGTVTVSVFPGRHNAAIGLSPYCGQQ